MHGFCGFWSVFFFEKFRVMRNNKNESVQSDGSDGEKMSEKPTLVKKGIRTFYGIVEDSFENRKENYDEVCHTEDRPEILQKSMHTTPYTQVIQQQMWVNLLRFVVLLWPNSCRRFSDPNFFLIELLRSSKMARFVFSSQK